MNGRFFTERNFLIGTIILMAIIVIFAFSGCSGGPLTTREKGAGIGAVGGAVVGGLVGSTVGHPGAGAAIGGALGLGTGALIGDQLQGREIPQANHFDPKDLIGLREADALNKISSAGFSVRIIRRDSQNFNVTDDWRENRINLVIDKGIVSKATRG